MQSGGSNYLLSKFAKREDSNHRMAAEFCTGVLVVAPADSQIKLNLIDSVVESVPDVDTRMLFMLYVSERDSPRRSMWFFE